LKGFVKDETEFQLRRMIMKRLIAVLIPVLMVAGGAYATGGTPTPNPVDTQIGIENNINTTQNQNV